MPYLIRNKKVREIVELGDELINVLGKLAKILTSKSGAVGSEKYRELKAKEKELKRKIEDAKRTLKMDK